MPLGRNGPGEAHVQARWWQTTLLAALVATTAGCWRPLVIYRAVAEQGELALGGAPEAGYAKRHAEPARPVANRPKVIAHRGYSAVAPENTLAAFRAAIDAGADAIEFDLRLTKDGHPVVMHDAAVDRTTDGHGLVADLTLAQVRALSANKRFAPRFAEERVPTLDEVLALARGRVMALAELKDPDRKRLPGLLAEALDRHDMARRTLVISFHAPSLARFRALRPEAPVGLLALPYDPPGRRAMQVKADAALGFFGALDRRVVKASQAAGIEVFTWTVNDPAALRRVARLGVDGIITDDVKAAQAAIAAAGRSRGTRPLSQPPHEPTPGERSP